MPIALASFAAALSAATLAWLASLRRRDASIADLCWGPGFGGLACLALALAGGRTPRNWIAAALVTAWGARLSWHIDRRGRGHGEDPRYRAMRAAHGTAFWWRSLFTVFWLQAGILWIVAHPLLLLVTNNGRPFITPFDVAGVILFGAGAAIEATADWQLARFRRNPANRGQVLDSGLWRYSRHPNYFGDALLWWGIYVAALGVPGGWITVGSPLLMTYLLRQVSGVTLLEEGLRQSKPGYAAYVARTPPFVPGRPRR